MYTSMFWKNCDCQWQVDKWAGAKGLLQNVYRSYGFCFFDESLSNNSNYNFRAFWWIYIGPYGANVRHDNGFKNLNGSAALEGQWGKDSLFLEKKKRKVGDLYSARLPAGHSVYRGSLCLSLCSCNCRIVFSLTSLMAAEWSFKAQLG
jgi:hypothetical protein